MRTLNIIHYITTINNEEIRSTRFSESNLFQNYTFDIEGTIPGSYRQQFYNCVDGL